MLKKLLYGLAGIPLTQQCWEKIGIIDRKVLRNFLNLPSSAPTIGLYNEYGIIPIKYRLYQRKLGMWKRINREETNNVIKECKREQINKELPWFKELVAIANELKVDLEEAKYVSKEVWKRKVSKSVFERVKRDFMEGMGNLRRYSNNAKAYSTQCRTAERQQPRNRESSVRHCTKGRGIATFTDRPAISDRAL